MALIGEMKYLTIGSNTYEIPTSELPIASSSTLGGIKIGTNLSIDSSTGVLSVTGIPSISITRNLTSGTKSATINIDGTDYDIYSETNTDQNVTQVPLNGANAAHGLLFSISTGATQLTNTVYTSNKIVYYDHSQTLLIYNSDRTKQSYYKYNSIQLANSTTSYSGLLKTANVTADRTYTLPDATGTIALTSDIHSIPTGGTAGQVLKKTSSTNYAVEWGAVDALPVVTSSDNNKVLTVVNGAWAAASLPIYNGGVS